MQGRASLKSFYFDESGLKRELLDERSEACRVFPANISTSNFSKQLAAHNDAKRCQLRGFLYDAGGR